MKQIRSLIPLLLVVLISGCASVNVGKSMHPVHVDELDVQIPELMVSSKVETPLVVVLDPEVVLDRKTVEHHAIKPIEVHNIRAFVRDHLPTAMSDYFQDIDVVGPDDVDAHRDAIIGHVRVSDVDVHVDSATTGYHTAARILGTATWSFALEIPGQEDFIFSYAGEARGNYAMSHVSETGAMYESTFSDALAEMLETYVHDEIHSRLRSWENDRPAPAGTDHVTHEARK